MDFQDTFSNIVFQVTFKAILSKVRNLHHHVTLDIKETDHLKNNEFASQGDVIVLYER
jgi:hypothetical protein